MIYLIGDSARCGKSTLARQFRAVFDGQVLSGDSTRVAIRETSRPEWLPDIFDKLVDATAEDDPPAKRIARFRRGDMVVWNFLQQYFNSAKFAGDDVLVDGPLWPSMLANYELDHRAVFLVDTSENHADRVIQIRDTAEHGNWMKDEKYTDTTIRKWAKLNVLRSEMMIDECKKYGYPYFDIAELGLDGSQQRASEYLSDTNINSHTYFR